MIKWLGAFALTTLLLSCGDSEGSEEQQLPNNFHIEGQIKGASNQSVTIEAQSDRGAIKVAETKTDAAGNYSLDGNIPGMGLYAMSVGSDKKNAILLPLEENDKAVINGDIQTFSIKTKISGTRWAQPLMRYMALFNDFSEKQMDITMKESDPGKQLELFKKLQQPLLEYVKVQIAKDPGNPVNIIFSTLLMPNEQEGFAGYDTKNLELLAKMDKAFQKEHPQSPFTAYVSEQIGQIQSQYESYQASTSGTVDAPEIAMMNPDGKELRLSSLKGKIVLVDFWASWCGPCRKENPNVVRLYKKYNGRGFEVFSVSLDENPDAWKQAIQKDGLIWKNHVSDLMGWRTPLVQQYGFQAIPYTVLINKEGKIIGIGLRGIQLEQKLEELLGK